jgi:hypothetical protein
MFNRLRSGALAGGGALLLILSISGMAMGASLTSDSGPVDTSFVDVDGDGVADHCQTEAAAENTEAAQAAFDAADLNDDGEISVSEAAQSGWTGGVNCNHGGYVSEVSQAADSCEAGDTEEPEGTETGTEEGAETGTEEGAEGTEEAALEEGSADCEAEDAEETEATEEAAADEETCEAVEAPVLDPATDTSDWNHGDWVTWVSKSEATGGKNCNHGGAVSEASKAANEAAKAERDAKKAERQAERDAKKAEQKAARDLRKAERRAGKANKGHGKPN